MKKIDDFAPDTPQASYIRAILPGSKCRFSIRFWNLEKEELQRLIWSVALEPKLGHKLGRCRYLGFGSLRLNILPESFIIDWDNRYSGDEVDWRLPLDTNNWINTSQIKHHRELQKVLDAKQL